MLGWETLARDVTALGAPVLGRALGGPAGAIVGEIIAKALGVSTSPEAVRTGLDGAPEAARDAICTIERAKADEIWATHGRMIEAIHATMRQDAAGDPVQRWWRPFVGYVFGLVSLLFGCSLVYDVVMRQGDALGRSDGAFWFFSLLAMVVGASAVGRSFEKARSAPRPVSEVRS